jgi:hypothetical protein
MIYKIFGNTAVVRIDRGEEIVSCVKKLCEKENIRLASITALGAVDHIAIGLYRVSEKKYFKTTIDKEMEMTSLIGNVTTKDGEIYLHFHANFAGEDGKVFGGHLNEAVVSGTCEMFITILNGKIERECDNVTGLNILSFN